MQISRGAVLRGVAKGIGWIFPILIGTFIPSLLFTLRILQNKVLSVVLFMCNPTTPFCTPTQKILSFIWVIVLGVLGAYCFAKERDERIGFVASFSFLFWIFQFLAVLGLVLVVDVIVPAFRIMPLA